MDIYASSNSTQQIEVDEGEEGAETAAVFMPFVVVFVSRLQLSQEETTED